MRSTFAPPTSGRREVTTWACSPAGGAAASTLPSLLGLEPCSASSSRVFACAVLFGGESSAPSSPLRSRATSDVVALPITFHQRRLRQSVRTLRSRGRSPGPPLAVSVVGARRMRPCSLHRRTLHSGVLRSYWPRSSLGCWRQPPSGQQGPEPARDEVDRGAAAPGRRTGAGRPKLTPARWPNDARVAVCLSFDTDTEAPLLRDGTTSPTTLVGIGLRRRKRHAPHPADARSATRFRPRFS